MRKAFRFITGWMIGSLVGGVLGLLLAPSSGDELRTQILDRCQVIQSEIKQAASARRAELEKQLATLRSPRNMSE